MSKSFVIRHTVEAHPDMSLPDPHQDAFVRILVMARVKSPSYQHHYTLVKILVMMWASSLYQHYRRVHATELARALAMVRAGPLRHQCILAIAFERILAHRAHIKPLLYQHQQCVLAGVVVRNLVDTRVNVVV